MAAHTALSRQTIWTFSVGDITTSAPMAIIAFFQLFFLTDVAGLNPALAAWPILIGKLWDAFNDPLAGFLADRVHSRFGRRRVLLMAAAGPVGLSFFLMWLVPPWEPSGLLLYYTLVYMVFDTTLTVVHIAYNSLAAGLSSDYDEQSSLHGVRMVYSIGGRSLR
jgi:GPH family glycoside/pentoside/hexuronide:cation symporter